MDIGRSRLFAYGSLVLALAAAAMSAAEFRAGNPPIDWIFNAVIAIFLVASATAHWRKRTPR